YLLFLQLARILAFINAIVQRCLQCVTVDEKRIERLLDSAVGKRTFVSLATEVDKVAQTVIGIMSDGVAHIVQNVSAHLSPLALKVIYQVFLGKTLRIFGQTAILPIPLDTFCEERTAEVSLYGLVESHLLERRSRVRIRGEKYIQIRIDKYTDGYLTHSE